MVIFCDFCKRYLSYDDCTLWLGSKNHLGLFEKIGICYNCSSKLSFENQKLFIKKYR